MSDPKSNRLPAVRIVVDCKVNDPVDVRSGGPEMLGFNFYVEPGVFDLLLLASIIDEVKRQGLPFLACYDVGMVSVLPEWIWSMERILTHIKEAKQENHFHLSE